MAKFIPPGFDSAKVIDGLHKAMGFGEPNNAADKATFYIVSTTVDPTAKVDDDGVPFDPGAARSVTPTSVQVSCAVELLDRNGQPISSSYIRPTKVVITLLDAEYQQIKGFAYVVIGGDQFDYSYTEPPSGLGSIDIWTVHATAEDDR